MPSKDDKYMKPKLSNGIKEEIESTGSKKQKESEQGTQHVANASNAKGACKDASKDGGDAEAESKGQVDSKSAKDCTQHWEDEQHMKNCQKAYQDFKKQNGHSEAASEEAQSDSGLAHSDDQEQATPKKRGRGANASGSSKKQKKNGSSDEVNGTAGDKTRVPTVGQKVQWKALPGFVDGEVVEVVYQEKTVEGKSVKASKEDPRIVLKSSSSGKIAVHKPEAVYFD